MKYRKSVEFLTDHFTILALSIYNYIIYLLLPQHAIITGK